MTIALEDFLNPLFFGMAEEARDMAGIVCSDPKELNEYAGHAVIRDPGHRLEQPPSTLEFLRKVATHRPVVIRGVPQEHFPRAWENWKSSEYLRRRMASPPSEEGADHGPRRIKVALTPDGHADDLVEAPYDKADKVFALPHEEDM